MSIVATMRCPGNTACGVRLAFVVAVVCLSNVAFAGFVPVGAGVSLEMCSEHRLSDWLTSFLNVSNLCRAGLSEVNYVCDEVPPAEVPTERQQFVVGLASQPTGCSVNGNHGVGPQTSPFVAMTQSVVVLGEISLVSRMAPGDDLRLPLKLPYKLFRPPDNDFACF